MSEAHIWLKVLTKNSKRNLIRCHFAPNWVTPTAFFLAKISSSSVPIEVHQVQPILHGESMTLIGEMDVFILVQCPSVLCEVAEDVDIKNNLNVFLC